ncbi:MAG: glycosyltransferase [Clostridiales bacterium]|nr:glycosyltransferase [Candidatus Equinaster intestinalis]
MEKVFVIIPSLDPDEKLKNTVKGLKEAGFINFILVDDGSSKENLKFFPKEDEHTVIIHHEVNKGKGAAMKTAFAYIIEHCPECEKVVTVDGDGQHLPKDVTACVNAVEENKMVLGCRNFNLEHVPKRSRFGNHTTSAVFRLLCGIKISDTQTGLRAYPVSLLPFLLTIKGDRFEFETNSLLKFKQAGYGFREVEIETVYIEENKTSHFRTVRDSLRVYSFVLKFAFSSLFACVVDIILFFLLNFFFGARLGVISELVCTAVARAASSFINFNVNRKRVFSADAPYGKSLLRYYLVAIPQMLLSAGLVTLFTILTHSEAVGSTVIKMIVDVILFFLSYRFQQTFVFADKKVKKNKKKSKALKVLGRIFGIFGTVLLCLVITVYSAGLLICYGPSPSLRDMLVISAKQASATKWAPSLFLTSAKIDEIMSGSEQLNTEVIETSNITVNEDTGEWDNCPDEGIKLCFIQKPGFKAYLLMVKDPARVKVGVSSENFKTAKEGRRILDIVEKYDCLAAINGGEFSDPGGVGTGAAPIGLTYSSGKNVWNDGAKRTFIGITRQNKLV